MKFFHFTNWDLDKIEIGRVYDTPWEQSHYWRQKTNNALFVSPEIEKELNALPPIKINGIDLKEFLRDYKLKSELLKEMIFEDVRHDKYNDAPSRKRCMFVFDETTEYVEYARLLGFETRNYNLIEIESIDEKSKYLKVDFSWLNCNVFQYKEVEEYAEKYWSGEIREPKKCEALFIGEFRINRVLLEKRKNNLTSATT